jgi:hypothetical protein
MQRPERFLASLRRNDPTETHAKIGLLQFSDDVRSLAEALQANSHVNMLEIDFTDLRRHFINWELLLRVIAMRANLKKVQLEDAVDVWRRNPPERIVPFLLAIGGNPKIQAMVFNSLLLSGDSMASFLDNATSVTELRLLRCDAEAPADALAIAAALQRNTNIQRLLLARVDERLVIPVLNSLTSGQSSLQSLVVDTCAVHQRERESFRSAIFSIFQPQSKLCSLELSHAIDLANSGFETAEDFARLFTAVELSPLESFKIGDLVSRVSCMALIASIPKMQLRTLEVRVFPNLQYMKRDIIEAVKRNASLRTVEITRLVYEGDWLDYNDRMKLIFYSIRNEFLWCGNPTLVPNAAWPVALVVAQATGPGTVFHILRTLAPSLWTSEA